MQNSELKQLHSLLENFINDYPGHHGSIYGRNMDVGIAKSAQSMLLAYGLKWSIEFSLQDGTTETLSGYSSEIQADNAAKWLMENENPSGYRISYKII